MTAAPVRTVKGKDHGGAETGWYPFNDGGNIDPLENLPHEMEYLVTASIDGVVFKAFEGREHGAGGKADSQTVAFRKPTDVTIIDEIQRLPHRMVADPRQFPH